MSEASKAVFLSYASQDAEAARRIADALRAAGIEVWFDQSELRGGDAWDTKIRKQIKECALFVPVISAATQARREGYFRLEWKLAEDRTHLMAKGTPFVVPVCIDDTKDWDAIVPDSFMSVQWTRLPLRPAQSSQPPEGEIPAKFCERVKALLSGQVAEVSHPPAAQNAGWKTEQPRTRGRRGPVAAGTIAAVIALAAGGFFWVKRSQGPASNAGAAAHPPVPSSSKGPLTVAAPPAAPAAASTEFPRDPDLKRALKLVYSLDAIVEDFALAEDLVKPLLAARPSDPEVATVAAVIAQEYLTRGFDTSVARRSMVQRLTERAVQLAPENPAALGALARYLVFIGSQLPRAEELLRRAIALSPNEPRYYRVLLPVLGELKPAAETEAFVARMSALFPKEPLVRYDIARYHKDTNNIAAMERALDETLALTPLASAMVWKCWLALEAHGDVPGMKVWLDRVPERQRTYTRVAVAHAIHAGITRQPKEAIQLLMDLPDSWLTDFDFTGPKALLLADVLMIDGRTDFARLQYETALDEIKAAVARSPTDLRLRRAELWTQLGLGRREAARSALVLMVQSLRRPYRVTMNNSWWSGPIRASLLLDERDQAVALLREAVVDPASRLILRNQFQVDPRMTQFHADREIVALLAEPESTKPAKQ